MGTVKILKEGKALISAYALLICRVHALKKTNHQNGVIICDIQSGGKINLVLSEKCLEND